MVSICAYVLSRMRGSSSFGSTSSKNAFAPLSPRNVDNPSYTFPLPPHTHTLSLSLAWISRHEEDVRPSIVNTLSPFLPPLERGLVKLATGRWADDGRLAEASPASRRLSSAEGDARARDWPNKYVPFLPCFFSSGRSRASGREQTGEAFLAFVCMSTSSAATSSGKDNVC
jgi:hypothetical protein